MRRCIKERFLKIRKLAMQMRVCLWAGGTADGEAMQGHSRSIRVEQGGHVDEVEGAGGWGSRRGGQKHADGQSGQGFMGLSEMGALAEL